MSGCRVEDSKDLRRRTVGRMLPGNQVRLMDESGKKEVPEGEPGVLYFRGPMRLPVTIGTRSLLPRFSILTAGPPPAISSSSTRDACEILGRAKDMIIRGGQNIYPEEIEGLLNDHPKVASVAVVGYPDREMGERACAYVIQRRTRNSLSGKWWLFLKSRNIAMFKLPERLEIVTEFPPVGDSGKDEQRDPEEGYQGKADSGGQILMESVILVLSTLDTKGPETL